MRYLLWKKIVLGVLFVSAMVLVFGFVVMHLWNWLVPAIFDGPTVNFWQALGVLLLARILTGGFRWMGWKGRHHMRHHWRSKWEQMSPDEREHWRSKMKDKCRWWEQEPDGDEGQQKAEK